MVLINQNYIPNSKLSFKNNLNWSWYQQLTPLRTYFCSNTTWLPIWRICWVNCTLSNNEWCPISPSNLFYDLSLKKPDQNLFAIIPIFWSFSSHWILIIISRAPNSLVWKLYQIKQRNPKPPFSTLNLKTYNVSIRWRFIQISLIPRPKCIVFQGRQWSVAFKLNLFKAKCRNICESIHIWSWTTSKQSILIISSNKHLARLTAISPLRNDIHSKCTTISDWVTTSIRNEGVWRR